METLKFSFGDFLHGADYNPEQWLDRPDILAKDIELMKKRTVMSLVSGCSLGQC